MFETTFDKMMYPIGFQTTMTQAVRKWRHLPPLAIGQSVTIMKLGWRDIGGGNLIPRLLVKTENGSQRWIEANVEPCTTGNEAAHKRLGEIATEFFARRD
jgi:hypothetical protein